MINTMFAVFTSVVAGLAVVGVTLAGGDDASTSLSAASEAEAEAGAGAAVSTPSTEVTIPDTSARADASTSASVDASAETNVEEDMSTTSTSVAATTSTSTGSSTSTSFDDGEDRQAPDGVSTHVLPGVGTVTIEVEAGQLVLVSVSAPGWNVERERIEPNRIELEFTTGLSAEAEFEARLDKGRVEVDIEVGLN